MAYNREKIQAELFELRDEKYRDFHSKLIPDMEKENIIGIRTPVLRKDRGRSRFFTRHSAYIL